MKYWDQVGKHTKLFNAIWEELVPAKGESDNPVGEMVRAFNRIGYDMGNNGAGNMYEDWGDGESGVLSDYFKDLYAKLVMPVGLDLVRKSKRETQYMVENYSTFSYKKPPLGEEEWAIDQIGDALGDYILKNDLYRMKNPEPQSV